MNLDETQKKKVSQWIEEGLKLSEIQKRIETELGVKLTYLDVRLLVDDLKLLPKDEPEETPVPAPEPEAPEDQLEEEPAAPLDNPSGVSVTVDTVARPGAIFSGSVTFSDGKAATWQLDQFGRLGLAPQQPGYKPSPADLQSFQMALQGELQKLGL